MHVPVRRASSRRGTQNYVAQHYLEDGSRGESRSIVPRVKQCCRCAVNVANQMNLSWHRLCFYEHAKCKESLARATKESEAASSKAKKPRKKSAGKKKVSARK